MGEETVVASEDFEVENAGIVLRGTRWSTAAAGASGAAAAGVGASEAAASAVADQADAVLLIHGACVDRSFYAAAAHELARRFTVITYDRRGYTDSALPTVGGASVAVGAAPKAKVAGSDTPGSAPGVSCRSNGSPASASGTSSASSRAPSVPAATSEVPADTTSAPDCSVATQAADAAAIIHALGGGAPMHVVAHSGGCVIAMELARSHPELVRRVVLDEPLFLDCLPDQSAFRTTTQRIFKALSEGKDSLALHLFMPTLGATDPRSRAHDETSPELFRANTSHFIQNEYVALSSYMPDYEALRGVDLCVLSSELDHGEQYPQCAREVAERLDAPLYFVPGTHNFPTDLPEEFARFVAGALLL